MYHASGGKCLKCYFNLFVSAGAIVLEALILTSAVVLALTGYTFWAAKKGKDFSYLGPILFTGLIILILTGFMQVCSYYFSVKLIVRYDKCIVNSLQLAFLTFRCSSHLDLYQMQFMVELVPSSSLVI